MILRSMIYNQSNICSNKTFGLGRIFFVCAFT